MSTNTPNVTRDRTGSQARLLAVGTLVALALAATASWLFVVRPASNESSSISPQDLVNTNDAPGKPVADLATVGAAAPDVTFAGFNGPDITVASLRGKPAVINFWQSTCVPCVAEMPLLERVYQQLGDEVSFVGVDVYEPVEAGEQMIERTGVTYPQTVDPEFDLLGRFAGTSLPHTVILSADGTVTAIHSTAITDDQELIDLIDAAR